MRIEAYRLQISLRSMYRLAFSTIDRFETVAVVVTDGETQYWGEATALPGYSWETSESIWARTREWLRAARGDVERLKRRVEAATREVPFAASPLLVSIARSARSLVDEGYSTLELKVFGSPRHDSARVYAASEASQGGIKIRVDGNESFTFADACAFVDTLDPGVIEHLEQPLPRGDWAGVERLAERSPVPLMLYEAV